MNSFTLFSPFKPIFLTPALLLLPFYLIMIYHLLLSLKGIKVSLVQFLLVKVRIHLITRFILLTSLACWSLNNGNLLIRVYWQTIVISTNFFGEERLQTMTRMDNNIILTGVVILWIKSDWSYCVCNITRCSICNFVNHIKCAMNVLMPVLVLT